MSSAHPADLFKWNRVTEEPKSISKPQNPGKPPQKEKSNNLLVEAWLERAEHPKALETTPDDVDVWLNKVRKAADVANNQIVHSEESAFDVSSLFSQVISSYLPDEVAELPPVKLPPEPKTETTLLDDNYDSLTEARSILSGWLSKKSEINYDHVVGGSSEDFSNKEEQDVPNAMKHLMDLPIEKKVLKKIKIKSQQRNPAAAIAERHKRAKERREKLEVERIEKLKAASLRKAARQEADRVLMEERARREREEKEEEEKIKLEMVQLRKNIQEEQQQKMLRYEKEREEEMKHHHETLALQYRQVIMETAEEEIKRKQLVATRNILLKQLQEAETKELRERYSVLQRSFSLWRQRVMESSIAYKKAFAYSQWKTQLSAWKKWRRFYQDIIYTRQQRIQAEIWRENKNTRIADLHYQHHRQRDCFTAWRCWARECCRERREKQVEEHKKMLMEKCLAAASLASASPAYDTPKIEEEKLTPKLKGRKIGINFAGIPRKSPKPHIPSDNAMTSPFISSPVVKDTKEVGEFRPHKDTQVKAPNTEVTEEQIEEFATQVRNSVYNPWNSSIKQPITKPVYTSTGAVTKKSVPAALRGMEKRARERQERHAEIQRRKEERRREEERLKIRVQEEKEEAEKERKRLEKEQRLKDIEEARRREQERLDEIKRMKDLMLTAANFYRDKLRRRYVIIPLRDLCESQREKLEKANEFYERICLRRWWKCWIEMIELKELEKVEKAEAHYRVVLYKLGLNAFKKVLRLQDSYERIASRHNKRRVKHRHIVAWRALTSETLQHRQEMIAVADEFSLKCTLRSHFNGWRKVTPVLRNERESELRKTRLRSKIASLLPDYTPPSGD